MQDCLRRSLNQGSFIALRLTFLPLFLFVQVKFLQTFPLSLIDPLSLEHMWGSGLLYRHNVTKYVLVHKLRYGRYTRWVLFTVYTTAVVLLGLFRLRLKTSVNLAPRAIWVSYINI